MSLFDTKMVETLKAILEENQDTSGFENRPVWADGTSATTIKKFGVVTRYDLREEFPIMTLRPAGLKNLVDEILWIWQKKSNNVNDLGSHIWDSWADEEGSIGKAYGYQLGKEFSYKGKITNQVDNILEELIKNPMSRRMLSNIYVHSDLDEMNLEPCVYSATFNVTVDENGNKVLNMLLNQRSQDMITANCWNVAQYAILLMMFARHTGMIAGELVHVIADCHIYKKHIPVAKELIERYERGEAYPAPKVTLNPDKTNFYDFTVDDVIMEDYRSGKQIKFEVAV